MASSPEQKKRIEAETRFLEARAEALQVDIWAGVMRRRAYDSSDDEARLYPFVGVVDARSVQSCIDSIRQWARDEPDREITVELNTPGGGLTDGMALYDAIREIVEAGTPVRTHAIGTSLSMGTVLLQAGTRRTMTPNAYLMIHAPSMTSGASSMFELEDETVLLKRMAEHMKRILSERSNLTPAAISRKWKRKEWWLGADEALDAGLVDEVTK